MILTRRRRFLKSISLRTAQLALLVFILVFVIAPIIFRYSISLQRGLLFLTFVTYPKNLDYQNPPAVGLYGTRNFYIKVKDEEEFQGKHDEEFNIGLWHVLPRSLAKRFSKELKIDEKFNEDLMNTNGTTDQEIEVPKDILQEFEGVEITKELEQQFYEKLLSVPNTVIVLYFHGNTASRGSGHRVDIYKVLRNLNYHVITFDYRSYGDSDKVPPSEDGLVNDGLTVFNYIRTLTDNPVIFWGHSLGTGVSSHLLANMERKNIKNGPKGLILEAPFTNIKDEIREHPFAKPFKNLPWFDLTIANPMHTNSLRFESDKYISQYRQPVYIMHAEDDYVIPFHLGYKLYRTALDTRNKTWGQTYFKRFDESFHYGHKFICRAPELPALITKFVDTYKNEEGY
ncbi:ABHD12B family protein [Megaselia abdita]